MNIDDSRLESRPTLTPEQMTQARRNIARLAPDLLPMTFGETGGAA
mgnify:FL=1